MTFFDRWCWSIDYLGAGYKVAYPRWLRRLYIATWPIAAPIKFVLFSLDVIAFLAFLGIGAAIMWTVDKVLDFGYYLSCQWFDE